MRASLNSSALITAISVVIALTAASCGVDKKNHYPNKTFGVTPNQTEDESPVTTGEPDVTLPEPAPAPEEDRDTDPAPPQDQLLSYYQFGGYFNFDSVRRMFRGTDEINGDISQGGFLDEALAKLLGFIIGKDNLERLTMKIQQNGEGRNLVTQVAQTGGGDNIARFKGDESQSGRQFIDWAIAGTEMAAGCPGPFVCAERLVWVPDSGETMTFCYRDHITKKPISIPYNPNPHFSSDAFSSVIGTGMESGPIEVVKHPGNVRCDDDSVETRDIQLVAYRISMGNLADQARGGFLKRAIHKPVQADTEISLEYNMYHPTLHQIYTPKKGPYIDQRARLNSKMRFFLSGAEHVVVKIERTVQSPMKLEPSQITEFIREAYGDTAAYLAALIFAPQNDTEGVQLVYSFEFCTHLGVISEPYNHCTGLIQP